MHQFTNTGHLAPTLAQFVQGGLARLQSHLHYINQKSGASGLCASNFDQYSQACACQNHFERKKSSATTLVQRKQCCQQLSMDVLLTAIDGVSLEIASYLDVHSLIQVSQVSSGWNQFIKKKPFITWESHLEHDFDVIIKSSSTYKSYLFSLRHTLERELSHCINIEPPYSAMERYCASEPNHGFMAVFGDICYFEDARIARFVAHKRQYALNMVIAMSPDSVRAFRKKSDYQGPIAFVPVDNPHWPQFELPPVNAEGFLGYAFDHVKIVPGFESLKNTVVKSILKELMVFDTQENATAYGRSIGVQPFCAILEEDQVDPKNVLTFTNPIRRGLMHYSIADRIRILRKRLDSLDYAISRC